MVEKRAKKFGQEPSPLPFRAMPERKHFFYRSCSLNGSDGRGTAWLDGFCWAEDLSLKDAFFWRPSDLACSCELVRPGSGNAGEMVFVPPVTETQVDHTNP